MIFNLRSLSTTFEGLTNVYHNTNLLTFVTIDGLQHFCNINITMHTCSNVKLTLIHKFTGNFDKMLSILIMFMEKIDECSIHVMSKNELMN